MNMVLSLSSGTHSLQWQTGIKKIFTYRMSYAMAEEGMYFKEAKKESHPFMKV